MLLNNIKRILLSIFTLIIIGCSAVSYVQKVIPVDSSLAAYDKVYVDV